MRKFLAVIFILASFNLFSQSFTFETENITLSDTLESEIVFDFLISNTSEDTLTLYIKWAKVEFPNEWEYAVCLDENCYAPFIDSITTSEEFLSSPLAPGNVRDFSMHIIPKLLNGTGTLYIKAGNLADLSDTVSVILTASTSPLDVNEISSINSFRLLQNYPNPFNPSTDIVFEVSERSYLTLNLFSVTGEKVVSIAEGEFMPGIYRHTFDASKLSSGLYIARLSSDIKHSVIKIMLEK